MIMSLRNFRATYDLREPQFNFICNFNQAARMFSTLFLSRYTFAMPTLYGAAVTVGTLLSIWLNARHTAAKSWAEAAAKGLAQLAQASAGVDESGPGRRSTSTGGDGGGGRTSESDAPSDSELATLRTAASNAHDASASLRQHAARKLQQKRAQQGVLGRVANFFSLFTVRWGVALGSMALCVWPGLSLVYQSAKADQADSSRRQGVYLYLAYLMIFLFALGSSLFQSACFGLAASLNDGQVQIYFSAGQGIGGVL